MTKAQLLAVGSTAGLEAGGVRPPTLLEIAARLRRLAGEMDDIAVMMDYYGGFSEWAAHGWVFRPIVTADSGPS